MRPASWFNWVAGNTSREDSSLPFPTQLILFVGYKLKAVSCITLLQKCVIWMFATEIKIINQNTWISIIYLKARINTSKEFISIIACDFVRLSSGSGITEFDETIFFDSRGFEKILRYIKLSCKFSLIEWWTLHVLVGNTISAAL